MKEPAPTIEVDVQRASGAWRDVPRAVAIARKAAKRAAAMGGVPLLNGAEIAVSLADDAKVREANRGFRGKDSPTNVLSFPGAPAERISRSPFLGDIILAYETVAAEAEVEGKAIGDHLAHLVVHGVLHLIGYDHMTDDEAERMERLETAILATLDVADPYAAAAAQEQDGR